jgi:phosphoribosylamine--glycine ligase
MIDPHGVPRTLEFNCRMGDPETQPIMARLKSDLISLLDAAVDGRLDQVEAEWDRRTALGVVVAATGYPDAPRKGDVITRLPENRDDCIVFHAGTTHAGDTLVTNGGRVLCITALGDTVRAARRTAYEAVEQVQFDGMQFRGDIGHRALRPRTL